MKRRRENVTATGMDGKAEDRLAFSQKKRSAVKHERRDGKWNFILRGDLGLGVYGLGSWYFSPDT